MKAKIYFEETLTQFLDSTGEQIASNCTGKLMIQNPSNNTTLWSIKLGGEVAEDISNYEEQEISHIQAGKNFTTYYKVRTGCQLQLTEKIDTFTNDETESVDTNNNTLITGLSQQVMFDISLRNNYDFPLTNIELIKQFDQSCLNYRIIQPYVGSIEESENAFIWKLDNLDIKTEINIRVIADFLPVTSDPVPTGEINVRSKGEGQLSSLKPTIVAESDNVDLSIEINETQDPGQWEINTEYTNNSEFDTLLNTIKLQHGDDSLISEDIGVVFDADPGGEAWKREGPSWKKVVDLQSDEYPVIDKDYDYNVVYDVNSGVTVAVNKENDFLKVVEISVEKQFQPPKINTYTRSPLLYTLLVQNTGTAVIDKLKVVETIPPYIVISSIEIDSTQEFELKAKIDDATGLDEKAVELIDKNEEIPDTMCIHDPRKLYIDLDLPSFFPGSKKTIRVNCIAEKPKPNLDYSAQSSTTAFPHHLSQGFTIDALTEDATPGLVVSYAKRSFKDRVTYQALKEGKYEISIQVSNNGNVPLEKLKIVHDIGSAKYQSHTPENVKFEVNGNEVEFSVSDIQIDDEITIKMIVATDGPLRQRQPVITIERATELKSIDLGSAITTIMGMYPELYLDNETGKLAAENDLKQFNYEGIFTTQSLREFSVKVISQKLKDLPPDTTTFEFKTHRGVKDEQIQEELKITRLYNPGMEHTIFRPDGSIKLKEYDLLSIGSDYFTEHAHKHPPMLNTEQEIVWKNKVETIQNVLQILLIEAAYDKPTHDILKERTYKAFTKNVWDIIGDENMRKKLHEIIQTLV